MYLFYTLFNKHDLALMSDMSCRMSRLYSLFDTVNGLHFQCRVFLVVVVAIVPPFGPLLVTVLHRVTVTVTVVYVIYVVGVTDFVTV